MKTKYRKNHHAEERLMTNVENDACCFAWGGDCWCRPCGSYHLSSIYAWRLPWCCLVVLSSILTLILNAEFIVTLLPMKEGARTAQSIHEQLLPTRVTNLDILSAHQNKTFCLSWDTSSNMDEAIDEWWTHNPQWQVVSIQNDEGYCFERIPNATRRQG